MSKSEVQRRTVVADPEYREKFFDELRKMSGTDKLITECNKAWSAIHRKLDIGELKPSAAAKEVKSLQEDFKKRCPKYKAPKKAGSARKKKSSPKNSPLDIPAERYQLDDDSDEFELVQPVADDALIECGILTRDGLRLPAIRRETDVVVFDWSVLLKHSPAKNMMS